jgi:hypothetical protein
MDLAEVLGPAAMTEIAGSGKLVLHCVGATPRPAGVGGVSGTG